MKIALGLLFGVTMNEEFIKILWLHNNMTVGPVTGNSTISNKEAIGVLGELQV